MTSSALFFIAAALWALNVKHSEGGFLDNVMATSLVIIAAILLWKGHV